MAQEYDDWYEENDNYEKIIAQNNLEKINSLSIDQGYREGILQGSDDLELKMKIDGSDDGYKKGYQDGFKEGAIKFLQQLQSINKISQTQFSQLEQNYLNPEQFMNLIQNILQSQQ